MKWKRQIKNNLSFKIDFFSGALQKFVMDANGEEEEESKTKHEELGAKEEEGNETGIIDLKFIFHLNYFHGSGLISSEGLPPYAGRWPLKEHSHGWTAWIA